MTTLRKVAVWELGFRPFFLLGLLAASALVAAWLWLLTKGQGSTAYFEPVLWHAHEMIYGFAVAVVIGFILTASQSWTGTPGVKGRRLQLLAALWLLARLLIAFPIAPAVVTAAVDLAFLPLAVAFLVPYLSRPGQRHNVVFLVLPSLLALGNLLMHLGALGVLAGWERRGVYLGLHVVLLAIVVVGGRVIPFFSERAVPGYGKPRAPWIGKAALVSVAAFLVASFADPQSPATGLLAAVAAAFNLGRWLTWWDRRVWRVPILAVLYVGYAWVIAGFAMTALATASLLSPTVATHAFTVGGIGTMIIGMVSRVSLGHTGRPLVATRVTVAAYGLVTAAAATRVFGPLLVPGAYMGMVQVSGVLWTLAFAMVLVTHSPILLRPRGDGRPG